MAHPKIILTKHGDKVTATCGLCKHPITKPDKKTAVQNMIGHLAGRHREDLTALLSGEVTVVDNT